MNSEPESPTVRYVASVRWVSVGAGALLAIVIVIAALHRSEPTSLEGAQATPANSVVMEQAAANGWEAHAPTAGELRAGFPAPMVWTADRICIGFARIDFGPEDLQPSTARCVPRRAANVAANEIRSLLSIESGFDT